LPNGAGKSRQLRNSHACRELHRCNRCNRDSPPTACGVRYYIHLGFIAKRGSRRAECCWDFSLLSGSPFAITKAVAERSPRRAHRTRYSSRILRRADRRVNEAAFGSGWHALSRRRAWARFVKPRPSKAPSVPPVFDRYPIRSPG
jgi:hypothetical protein